MYCKNGGTVGVAEGTVDEQPVSGEDAEWRPAVSDAAASIPEPLGGGEPAGMPRWVKVFAAVAVIVVVLIVIMLVTGHGPGRHMSHGLGVLAVSGGGSEGPRR